MSYMVCHGMKSKAGDIKNIEKHIERKNKDYKNKDIDKSKTHLNYDLHYERYQSYKYRINERIKEEYTGTRAIRKDAIFMVNFVISSDQEFFKNLSEERQREYFKISYDYLKDYFGEKNVVSAKVHLDETTPHMHFTAIPLIDGKLNAKKLMNRNFLRKIQDELPKILNDNGFEIERGIEGSKRKHIETETYKKELERQLNKTKLEIDNLKKEQKALESNISDFKSDLDVIEDINAIESKKTFLGQNRAISEGDYEKILLNFTKMALEKQKLEKEILFLKNNSEIKDSNIKHLENSIEYYRKRKIEDEKEFKNTLNELKDKINELNKTIDSNYKDIKKKVREDHAKGIEKLLDNLNEMREENEELKKLNERYKNIADNRIDTIIDLYKEKEWTDEFLELIGKEKMLKSFIENKREKEEEFYNNSHSYNYLNKSKENEHEMSL